MAALVVVRDLVKSYPALRPLRIRELVIEEGQIVSLLGLDAPAAEVLVGLLTGALLPDTGEVRLFDRSTADVGDSDAWLAMLDGVGIITERAVLVDQLSVEQNVAMPFTLAIDPIATEFRRATDELLREVGIAESDWAMPVGRADAETKMRVRLARAVALRPRVVLAEHPSATLPRDAVPRLAGDLARIARARSSAVLALTADDVFANALGGVVLTQEPASGVVRARSVWRKLFNR